MGLLAEAFGELFNPHYRAYIEPLPLSFGTTLTWPTRLRDGEAAAVLTWLSTATAVEVMVDGDRGAGSGRHGLGVGGVFASSTR